MEGLLLIGSLLASVTAFAAFVLGVTKTARLRRREQTLRESLAVFVADGPHRLMLTELHKATVAELVGRQMTSPWRLIWPWVAWAGLLATWAQFGFFAARYLAGDDVSWSGFVAAVAVDPVAAMLGLAAMPFLAYQVLASQAYTLTGRAEVVRSFFDGESVGRPESFSDATVRVEAAALSAAMAQRVEKSGKREKPEEPSKPKLTAKEAARNVGLFLLALAPGAFVTFLGLFVGMNVWLSTDEAEQLREGALHPLGGVIIPGLVVSGMAMVAIVGEVRQEVRRHALPMTHTPAPSSGVASGLWVPPRRPLGRGRVFLQVPESDG